ncbi:YjbF family lipoprotein [Salipiger sp. 1_MG-2023]|uniref:YjbF family lipoprotein n=1 Tax=Salipiger sp. 1_MG-2023 TaxID=3062665 RepID=UPI0026E354C2|nr:YjbF family lipoprotein [Salipiger sp. 1_MG-2023]MDO6586424.1 YjbF family lipoprotein [Salipiger sp. 1_MG-2023]
MIRRIALLAALVGLAACSNDPEYKSPIDVTSSLLFKGKSAPSQITPQQIVATLSTTPLPVIFLSLPDRETQALLLRIEQNGPYATYANKARQSVVLRDGMITGTRGLSGDLMSTDQGPLLDLVRARQTGTASYIQRWLTPEDVTRVVTYSCGVEPDKPVDVALGLVKAQATEVIAACESPDGPAFVDYYVVDGSGEILASRQWLGPNIGYAVLHRLRK